MKKSFNLNSRHAHKVTVLALQKLKKSAFNHSDEASLSTWEERMKTRSPTFLFWDLIVQYETLVLLVVRAQRQRNFNMYVEVLEQLAPLFFVLDHINYARWIPIHIRDMKSLPESIAKEFQDNGHCNKFSSIPFDQAHEQENKLVKTAGGAVCLTENSVAFRLVE